MKKIILSLLLCTASYASQDAMEIIKEHRISINQARRAQTLGQPGFDKAKVSKSAQTIDNLVNLKDACLSKKTADPNERVEILNSIYQNRIVGHKGKSYYKQATDEVTKAHRFAYKVMLKGVEALYENPLWGRDSAVFYNNFKTNKIFAPFASESVRKALETLFPLDFFMSHWVYAYNFSDYPHQQEIKQVDERTTNGFNGQLDWSDPSTKIFIKASKVETVTSKPQPQAVKKEETQEVKSAFKATSIPQSKISVDFLKKETPVSAASESKKESENNKSPFPTLRKVAPRDDINDHTGPQTPVVNPFNVSLKSTKATPASDSPKVAPVEAAAIPISMATEWLKNLLAIDEKNKADKGTGNPVQEAITAKMYSIPRAMQQAFKDRCFEVINNNPHTKLFPILKARTLSAWATTMFVEKSQNDVGQFGFENRKKSQTQASKPSVAKLKVSVAAPSDEQESSQKKVLEHTQAVVNDIQNQVNSMAQKEKVVYTRHLKTIEKKLEEAQQNYKFLEEVIHYLREEINSAYLDANRKINGVSLFSRFQPFSHAQDTHEEYLVAILKETEDLNHARLYNKEGVDQIEGARDMLNKIKILLNSTKEELTALIEAPFVPYYEGLRESNRS